MIQKNVVSLDCDENNDDGSGSRAVFGAHIVGSIPTVIFIFEF